MHTDLRDTTHRMVAPWHLWLVGGLALLFTGFGGFDYTMTQRGDVAYLDAAMGSMGVTGEQALAYFDAFPLWMEFAWAIGVWVGVAGALLLLARSRWAYPVFVISLAFFVLTNAYGFARPMPGLDASATLPMIGVVFVLMLLLTLYARAMAMRGVLR